MMYCVPAVTGTGTETGMDTGACVVVAGAEAVVETALLMSPATVM